jgi:tetratricopeptide (TPR) repeat protein
VQEKLENKDAAILDYKKSLELDPAQHDAAYNLGAHYYNKGVDKINEANDLPLSQAKKFEAMKAEAKKDFEAAIPYVEMANKAKPEDGDTATMLIKLYTQVGEYEKAKELKAKYE